MTKHPSNPECPCDLCYVADLNAVLRRFVEQREGRQIEQHNAAVLSNIDARSAWSDTFPDHAADLANAVARVADELQRGRG